MLFHELDKLKRRVIMTSIVLMFTGIILLIVPTGYIPFIGSALGFAMIVGMVVTVFHFIGSPRILLHYIQLCAALILGILGIALLTFDGMFNTMLTWLVGTVPILSGIIGLFYAFMSARRSGRKGWWFLALLSAVMMIFGGFVFLNPWMESEAAVLQVSGGTMMARAFLSAIRLIWLWPVRTKESAE